VIGKLEFEKVNGLDFEALVVKFNAEWERRAA
jgi:hypothetical protein